MAVQSVSIERNGVTHTANWTVSEGKMSVHSFSMGTNAGALAGFADNPEVLARFLLGEMVAEVASGSRALE